MELVLNGVCAGTMTQEFTDNETKQKTLSFYLGIQQEKKNGFQGEVETHRIKLSDEHSTESCINWLNGLRGKIISIPVSARSWSKNNKHGISISLLKDPREIHEYKGKK